MTQQKRRPVQFATYVDPDTAERLDQQAARANMSRAEFLRRVLERWLEHVEGGGDTSLESRESQVANREVIEALSEAATRSAQDSQTLDKIAQSLESLTETLSRPEPKQRSLGQRIMNVFRGEAG